jgi:SsrA-binding protein
MPKDREAVKVIAQNRKARHDFFIEETYEAGIVLQGTEVKSLRLGKANMQDSYAQVRDGEIFVSGLHISPYEMGNRFNHDPVRTRKLLLHHSEIVKLGIQVAKKGLTLIPMSLYFKKGMVKMQLAVAKGKLLHDKREDQADKGAHREIDRRMKDFNR